MKDKKITRSLWKQFTEAEERGVAQLLSGAIARHREARERKREAMRAMNEEIADLESEISGLAAKVAAHGEERPTECLVVFHKPTVGAKTVYRTDVNEKIAEEAMTPEECQEHLFEAGASA